MRVSEVLDTRVKDIEESGLNTRRTKGSNDALILWNEELHHAIDLGLDGYIRIPDMPIVNDGKGHPIRKHTFHTAWQRLIKKAEEAGIKRFTFHDLKAKGISDFEVH